MKRQCRVSIEGKVQGVSFRACTKREASRLKLTGYVKNLPDGRVEALFQGEDEALQKIVSWCHSGPGEAWVEHVEIVWSAIEEALDSFRVLLE